MIEYCPLTEQNYADVARIDRESLGEESWSEALYKDEIGQPEKVYVVAQTDGETVGFGGFRADFQDERTRADRKAVRRSGAKRR